MTRSVTLADYQYLMLTGLLTAFLCWALQELFERALGMIPRITTVQILQRESPSTKHLEMNQRMTKLLHAEGQYRVQSPGAIFFVDAILSSGLMITMILLIWYDPQWLIEHFVELKADTVWHLPYLHMCVVLYVYQLRKIFVYRHAKMKWVDVIHHWSACATCACILMGGYTPFGTWFGLTVDLLLWPFSFMFGFRAQFSYRYPEFTRKGFMFTFWWYVVQQICNISGQIALLLNSLVYHPGEIPLWLNVVMIFFILIWLYEDYVCLKILWANSKQRYELADVLDAGNKRFCEVMEPSDAELGHIGLEQERGVLVASNSISEVLMSFLFVI